jgi:hypothetical protein
VPWNIQGVFIMLSVITNIYNKKTKGLTLMELFTATGKLKKFFDNWRSSMCAPRVTLHTSIVAYREVLEGSNPPKCRSFDKAEPNSQFHGKYISNNLIRIWVSLICKLSGTPD